MKKKTNYFSHDSNARNDEKIINLRMRHGAVGYAVYFMILERLRDEADYKGKKDYKMIAFDLRVDEELIRSVVEDFGLFVTTEDGEHFYSESFNRRMSAKDEMSKLLSEAGKRGNAKRWGGYRGAMQNLSGGDSEATQNVSQESKVKKIIKKKISTDVDIKKESDDDAFIEKFLNSNSILMESLLMDFGLKPKDRALIDSLACMVDNEWKLQEVKHKDYQDWAKHLISIIRIKLNEQKKNNGTSRTTEKERAAEVADLVERMLAEDGADE